MTHHDKRITWPVTVVVVAGAVLVLAGGVVAWLHPTQLLPAGTAAGAGVHAYGARMAARAIPLGVALLALLAVRARRLLAGLLVLVAAIEIGDAISAVVIPDPAELAGALVVTVAFAWAAARLARAERLNR